MHVYKFQLIYSCYDGFDHAVIICTQLKIITCQETSFLCIFLLLYQDLNLRKWLFNV